MTEFDTIHMFGGSMEYLVTYLYVVGCFVMYSTITVSSAYWTVVMFKPPPVSLLNARYRAVLSAFWPIFGLLVFVKILIDTGKKSG